MISRHRINSSRGVVLVVVLVTIMAILYLVLSFNRQARLALQISDATVQAGQALACSQAGVQLGRHVLQEVGDVTTDKRTCNFFKTARSIPLANGICHLQLADESGKLNINRLKRPDQSLDRMRIDQFLRLIDTLNRQSPDQPHLSYRLVPILIDWTDNDTKTTVLPFLFHDNRGVETSGCANRALNDLTELQHIPEFTSESIARLLPFLTLYGDGEINLNSAPLEVLCCLSEHMDIALARLLIKHRERHAWESLTDIQRIPGISSKIIQDFQRTASIGTSGPYYQIEAIGQVNEQSSYVQALVKKNPTTQTVDIIRYEERRHNKTNHWH